MCFLEFATEFQKAQWAIIALQSNYSYANRAKLCGTPVEHAISKLSYKNSIWDIKDAQIIACGQTFWFVHSWKNGSAKRGGTAGHKCRTPEGFVGLPGFTLLKCFIILKTFSGNEIGMPQRRKECHRGSGGFLLSTFLPSPLLGDICSLMIMSFISACADLCHPDLCNRAGSLDCV